MHAVDGDGADQLQADDAHQQARVLHGVRHGQDAGADIALQKVDQGLTAPAMVRSRRDKALTVQTKQERENKSETSSQQNHDCYEMTPYLPPCQ